MIVSYDSQRRDSCMQVRNLIIHLKSEKVYLDAKLKFDNPAEMFEHYQKNSFTINNKEIFLTRGVGLTDWEFEHKNVRVGRVIGRGQFGEVRRGKLTLKSGAVVSVAIKSVKTDGDISKELIKEVMKEARLMRGLQHPNVVNLYGVGLLDQPLYILLEYVAGGALKSYLRKNKDTITIAEKIQMSLGAAWGIDYLHRSSILHRDIAARNCLYDHDSAVKISDFGLSRIGTEYKMKTAKKMPIKWMAPESIVSFMFSKKSDVYSYGVLVYEIWSSKDPYGDAIASVARKKIISGELNEFPSGTPEDLVAYVKEKLWNKNPEQREDMDKVCVTYITVALFGISFVPHTLRNFSMISRTLTSKGYHLPPLALRGQLTLDVAIMPSRRT
ncbi:protein tyrosine kinase [Cooperia oncophora]